MNGWYGLAAVVGLAAITVVTRGFFLIAERELTLPSWALRGLRYAPLAALAAIVVPEVITDGGTLIGTWKDARLFAAAAATAYFFWRRGILGTIVTGSAVMLTLRIGLGW